MIRVLVCVLMLLPISACADSSQSLPQSKKLDNSSAIIQPVEPEIVLSQLALPKESVAEDHENLPQKKTVCRQVKTKDGKIVNQCKTILVRKKYEGKTVPNYQK